ncbi:MAG TPA: HipA domain-containing protein [Candidatus Limnocylindrales bacterium]|nr:HipA domain-containing protein [Candidatus Limnocylindrales bacterium]
MNPKPPAFASDKTGFAPGASYLELIDLLQSQGANTREDTREIFRRVVFSILIHNTDDHFRNHGFFIGERGIYPFSSVRFESFD